MAARDDQLLRWIDEQGGVTYDVLQVLLGRRRVAYEGVYAGPVNRNFARGVARRWVRNGWATRRSYLGRTWVVPARGWSGLRLWRPSVAELGHAEACAVARLWAEAHPGLGAGEWWSERLLRAEDGGRGHRPDAEIWLPGDGASVAVEVELSRKKTADLTRIVRGLEGRYARVVYLCGTEGIAGRVKAARRARDAQGRWVVNVRGLPSLAEVSRPVRPVDEREAIG